MKRTITFLVALISLMASPSWATTYFVSNATNNGYTSGSDANACTSVGAPCLTVAGALGKTTPTVVNINPSGTPYQAATFVNPAVAVTIQTDQSLVTAQGKAVLQGTSSTRVLNVNASNVILNDLILDATGLTNASGITFQSGTGIQVNRVDIKNIASSGFHGFNQSSANTSVTLDKCTVTLANGNSSGTNFATIGAAGCSLTITGCTATGINSFVAQSGTPAITLIRTGASADGTRCAVTSCNFGVRFPASVVTTADIENVDFKTINNHAIYDGGSTAGTVSALTVKYCSHSGQNNLVNLDGTYPSVEFSYNSTTSPHSLFVSNTYLLSSCLIHDNTVNTTGALADPIIINAAGTGIQIYNNNITSDTSTHLIQVGPDSTNLLSISNTAAATTSINLGDTSGHVYLAVPFTMQASTVTPNSKLLTNFTVKMKKVGSPNGTVTCALYNDSAGSPGTVVATSEYSMPASGQTSTTQWVLYHFATHPNMPYGAAMWAVFQYNGTVDGSNYVVFDGNAAGGTVKTSPDASTWSAGSTSALIQICTGAFEMINPIVHDNVLTATATGTAPHAIIISQCYGGKTYRNICINNGGGANGIGVANKDVDGSGANTMVNYDNLMFGNGTNWRFGDKGCTNSQWYHNTAITTSVGAIATPACTIFLIPDLPKLNPEYNDLPCTSPTLENNIIYANAASGSGAIVQLGSNNTTQQPTVTGATINYNVLYAGTNYVYGVDCRSGAAVTVSTKAAWQALGFDLNSSFADPILANESTPTKAIDFRPPYNSPAIGMGTDLSAIISPYTDYLGVSYVTASPTVGALNALFRTTTSSRTLTTTRTRTSTRTVTSARTVISAH